ncbi:phosphate/phosphite/phosphonate ABC transporter substrate-binding protein [Marinobacter fonticola]|uniref:phosphate/phosphite/phosphonate ABC transporter substrate-binding protein n=1 Tax=Marinobacter fonticola TaxID=2603215 RepID=UPI0011E75674|nr:phosphate/phosphite/phosphonate ABC transporter substrate-binding protein [Marinobacter fonticola]
MGVPIKFNRSILAYGLFLLLLAKCGFALSAEYTFGVVPQQPAAKLFSLWRPLLEEVKQTTGIRLVFKTAPSIPAFEKALSNREYDFAYMNPYHYAIFSTDADYTALVVRKTGGLKGILVARRDSDVDSLLALNGHKVAFPSPAAFAASMLVRRELSERGVHIIPQYVKSHDSVYLGVHRGLYAAGGGVERTWNTMGPEVRDQLKVLWRSDAYISHPIAALDSLPEKDRESITSALVDLVETDEGRTLLKALNIPAFRTVADSEFDVLRALDWSLLEGNLHHYLDL